MRWLVTVVVVSCALSLSGCALTDLVTSLLGGTDSNQADMSHVNPKNDSDSPDSSGEG